MPNLGQLLEQQKSGFIKIPAMECGGPGSGRKPGFRVGFMPIKKASSLWTKHYGKEDNDTNGDSHHPFAGDNYNKAVVSTQNGKPVVGANITKDNETAEGKKGAVVNEIRSHVPGGAASILDYLKSKHDFVEGEAETSAGKRMFEKNGFVDHHEGGVGRSYVWFKDNDTKNKYEENVERD